MDSIIIKGLKIFAYHGVKEEEKKLGQSFTLDITMYKDLKKPGITDKLSDTVSYSDIQKMVAKVFTNDKYDLIERAAYRIAEEILKNYDVNSVNILLKKPQAPIKAEFEYVAVNITINKDDINE